MAGKGYPVEPVIRRAIPPASAIVKPQQTVTVTNPGDYFTGLVEWVPTGFPVDVLVGDVPNGMFRTASKNFYNCMEIDAVFPASPRGWVVPDRCMIDLEQGRQIPLTQNLVWNGDPDLFRAFSTAAYLPSFFVPFNPDFMLQIPKTYIAPVLGDPTNSSTLPKQGIFRGYGLQSFNVCTFLYWQEFTNPHNQYYDYQPSFIIRQWYDPLVRTSVETSGGS